MSITNRNRRVLRPRIVMFSPFEKPFSNEEMNDDSEMCLVVSPKVEEYMVDDNTRIVAKCTPCQCCACR